MQKSWYPFKPLPNEDPEAPSKVNTVLNPTRVYPGLVILAAITLFFSVSALVLYYGTSSVSLAVITTTWVSPELYLWYTGVPKVSMKRLATHLKALETLADSNNHSRSVANGHPASVEYILEQLSQWNDTFEFWTEDVPLFVQVDRKTPTFQFNNLPPLNYRLDFTVRQGSGSKTLKNAPVVVVSACSFQDPSFSESLLSLSSSVNDTQEWVAVIANDPAGPSCSICSKILFAIDLGASAVITYQKPGNFEGYPTVIQPSPGYCVRGANRTEKLSHAGLVSLSDRSSIELLELLAVGGATSLRVSLEIESSYKQIISKNVVAESKHGSSDSIIVYGSHLDSVPNGPGVNDDGSGAMGTLELAHTFHLSKLGRRTKSKVRFAWWTGEEIGLLGSFYYMSQVEKNETLLAAHKLNVDTDMIGSSNFVRGLWDASTIDDPTLKQKCKGAQNVFAKYFHSEKLPWVPFYFNGRSDFEPFMRHGIPAAGVITGEDEIKTPEQAELFGGVSGMVLDPCYHQECDRFEQMRGSGFQILKQNMHALAYSLSVFASITDLDAFLNQFGRVSGFEAMRDGITAKVEAYE